MVSRDVQMQAAGYSIGAAGLLTALVTGLVLNGVVGKADLKGQAILGKLVPAGAAAVGVVGLSVGIAGSLEGRVSSGEPNGNSSSSRRDRAAAEEDTLTEEEFSRVIREQFPGRPMDINLTSMQRYRKKLAEAGKPLTKENVVAAIRYDKETWSTLSQMASEAGLSLS